MLSIGEVAEITGVKIPTIRFYEDEGLLPDLTRTESGRRLYADQDVQRVAFIKHARGLGFELSDIRSLLDLSDHPDRPCDDATRIAAKHLAEVERRLEQLRALKAELARVVVSCKGRRVAECRVIESLGVPAARRRRINERFTISRDKAGSC